MRSHRGGSNHSQGRIARRRGLTLGANAAFAHRSHGRDSASSANCEPPEELKPDKPETNRRIDLERDIGD